MSMLQRTIKVLQQLNSVRVNSVPSVPIAKVISQATSSISVPSISPIPSNAISPNATSLSPFAITFTLKSSTAPPALLSATLSALHRALQPIFPLKRSSLPTHLQKWTLLSSPFTHKTARTQLERRTGAVQVRVEGIWGEGVRERVSWWVKRVVPGDVELEVTIHERVVEGGL